MPNPATTPPVYDLSRLTLREMTECGAALRRLGTGAASMEEAANRVVRLLHSRLADATQAGEPACMLVRCFKTQPFGELDAGLQRAGRDALEAENPTPEMRCLTLLATAGELPEWNDRRLSAGHRVIPLPSERGVRRIPMIAHLIRQLGLEVGSVLRPDPAVMMDLQQHTFNVFHVPQALGSPHIPAQEAFVKPFGVRSVLGFGSVFPTGDLFAVVLFARVEVRREVADLFAPLALSVKLALLPFVWGPIFTPD